MRQLLKIICFFFLLVFLILQSVQTIVKLMLLKMVFVSEFDLPDSAIGLNGPIGATDCTSELASALVIIGDVVLIAL